MLHLTDKQIEETCEAIKDSVKTNKELRQEKNNIQEDLNKLINYIAIKEDMDYKEVVKKFAILDERIG